MKREDSQVLTGAHLVLDDRVLWDAWLLVRAGRIVDLGSRRDGVPAAASRVELGDAFVFPGFIDVHVHGGAGGNFGYGVAGTERAAAFHTDGGTTAVVATLATASPADLAAQVELLAGAAGSGERRLRILGIHLEGPFISPDRRGAHDPRHIRVPDRAEFERLRRVSGGLVRTITLAPELAGYPELADAARAAEVLVSLGHTDADGATFAQAIGAGAGCLTHTFNGMRPITHRDPGVIQALTDTDVFCELICDGVHVHESFVRLLRRTVGPERIVLITDALAGTGLPDGIDGSSHLHTELRNGAIFLAGTDTLIASVLTMAEAVRRYAQFTGAGMVELARVASTNAAIRLREDHRLGRIRPGYLADLTILNSALEVVGVLTEGTWAREMNERSDLS